MTTTNVNQSDLKLNKQRSANYKFNIWQDNFIQSLGSEYDKEEFNIELNKHVIEVKGRFVQELGVLQKLELVEWIQKLGLANHFQKEINEFLETIFVLVKNNVNPSMQENLHLSALCFRLLRQHGYEVSPDMLGKFLDERKGIVMRESSISNDTKAIVELLEASYLGLEGENTLDEAKNFAVNWLKGAFTSSSFININELANLDVQRVAHALELPSHWRVIWFDVKWNVKQYQKDKHMDSALLALAKLNFNLIQAKLQKEVKELSRWWEKLGIKEHLNFARNRLVESFSICATGVAFEPKFKSLRKWLTKVIIFVLVIDDIYDIQASFEELKPFTMAFERWDTKELEELPEYMRICFNAFQDVTNEIAYEIGGEKNFDMVLTHLKKAWIDFFNALYVEAKWDKEGYIPSLEEYLWNGWISSSGPVILLHSYFATMHDSIYKIDDFLHIYEDLVYNVSLVIRLCNDLATTKAEIERGDVASSIICYMNQMGVSEEDARKHIQEIINSAWKKINGSCYTQVASVEPFLTQAKNVARCIHILYLNGDGFGNQDQDIKKYILSLLVEPLK